MLDGCAKFIMDLQIYYLNDICAGRNLYNKCDKMIWYGEIKMIFSSSSLFFIKISCMYWFYGEFQA